LNFVIPLTFPFSTQPRNVVVKAGVNAALDKGDLGELFFCYAQQKPHVFIVCKYINDYLRKVDGFRNVLEFGIDVVKTLLIASCFQDKSFSVLDSNNIVVERTRKYISFCGNINVGIADILRDDFSLLAGNHDSFFLIQMDSYFSNEELSVICEKIYSAGIKDVLLVSPSIVYWKSIISIRTAINDSILARGDSLRYKRNVRSLSDCFSRHFLLFYKQIFYIYDMPYGLLHFRVK
jgi:hypothetical protein